MFTEENNKYWTDFSATINADFEERKYWHFAKAIYNYKGYNLVFDDYIHYTGGRATVGSYVTRIYCKFVCSKKIYLKLEKNSMLSKFLNLFSKNKVTSLNKILQLNYIVFSNEDNIDKILSKTLSDKLVSTKIENLFIDTKDGIWGDNLQQNMYELATFKDVSKTDQNDLQKIKIVFEEIIDQLENYYYIKPIS